MVQTFGVQANQGPARGAAWDGTSGFSRLTVREREIMALLATGAPNKEVAATLILSENTVKTHIMRIMTKTCRRNRVDLVNGWLEEQREPGAARPAPAPPPAPVSMAVPRLVPHAESLLRMAVDLQRLQQDIQALAGRLRAISRGWE